MFFNRYYGESRPLSRVRKALVGKNEVLLSFEDGESMTVSPSDWENVSRDTVQQMIPAQHGTYLLSVVLNAEDGDPVFREVVVGWAVCADGLVYPVTFRGINAGDPDERPVLHPDGRVEATGGAWPSESAWLNEQTDALGRKPDQTT